MQNVKEEVIDLLPLLPLAPGERLPPGATPQAIDQLQQELGVPLPPQLAEWLLVCNGPRLAPGGVYGIRPNCSALDIAIQTAALPSWCDKRFIAVAGDGCGSHYAQAIAPEHGLHPIYFIDHEAEGVRSEPDYAVASGLWQFLRFLWRRELGAKGWPCDAHQVLQSDPELINIESRLLPWSQ